MDFITMVVSRRGHVLLIVPIAAVNVTKWAQWAQQNHYVVSFHSGRG
jgi:hypothetical protein